MGEKIYELTNPQKSIWLTEEYFSNTAINTICGYVYITDKTDLNTLEKAINELVKANDGMRLKFKKENNTCVQYVEDYEPFKLEVVSLSSEDEIEKTALKMANTPFIQDSKYYFKFILFKLPNGSGGFIVNVHHLIGDSWSLGLIAKESTTIYSELLAGNYEAKDCPSYLNFVEAENTYKNSDKFEKDKAYWAGVFETIPEIASISTIKTEQKSEISCKGKREKFTLSKDELKNIKEYCDKNKISVYNFFMAIYSLYVSRVSGLDDFVMGTPILNRTNFEQKHTMGMFISVAPLRINVNHDGSFADFAKKVAIDTMSLFRHQKYSYQTVLEEVRKRDSSIPNLYNVILSYQITKTTEESNGVNYSTDWVFNGNSSDELQIHLFDLNETDMTIAYDYKADLFSEQDISNLHNRILAIVDQIVLNEGILLNDIDIVTPEEKRQILVDFNNTNVDYPHDKTVVDLFEEQVLKTPDNVAVVFEDKKLTYRELNEKANQLARYLIIKGIKKGDIVGLRLNKSLEMIIGILAIIKAGACYLPMNMAYPEDRVNYMLNDSNCKLLLTSSKLNDISYNIIRINIDLQNIDIYSGDNTNLKLNFLPEDLLYIIYTSGSTGKPKGAMLSHKNIVRLMKNDKYLFDFCKNDVWTMFHSVAFDFSVWEMYGALLYGGKLVLVSDDIAKDPHLFRELLKKEKVTILNQTPSYFYNLQKAEMFINDNDLKIRYIIFGGEALTPSLIQDWNNKYPHTKLINMYGITETTVHVTFKNLSKEDLQSSSSNIGKPIPTLHVLVLDKHQNLLPFGYEGEMCVLGDGVFKGYLNRPELNTQKVISIPKYSSTPIYRSGDSAILHENGELEYIGRIDTQVKVRGFRVELGEIQDKILKYANISRCIVCKKEDTNGREVLCAYYIKNGPVNITVLKNRLTKDLPYYMIPQYFIEIEAVPINFNGKTDFKALPLPNFVIEDEEMLEPETEVEKVVYKVYNSILGIDGFSMNSSFYDLGGDSLTAISISSKLSEELGKNISVKDVLENPILIDMAKYVDGLNSSSKTVINRAEKRDFYPASSAQKRIYYASSVDNSSILYNIAGGIVVDKVLDIKLLQKCLEILIDRHEVLRTRFDIVDNEIVQIIEDKIDFTLAQSATTSNDINSIYSDFVKPFDLSKAPLFSAMAVTLNNDKTLLLLDMHHIISDGASLSILMQELCDLYNGQTLPEKKVDYKDFTLWENAQFGTDSYNSQRDYWVNQYKDDIPLLNMPTSFARPSTQSFEGANYYAKLPREVFEKVNEVSKKLGITPYMLMLSAYYILLSKYSSQDDIVVGTAIANRELPELSNMLGMFVNTLALRNKVNHSYNFSEFANSIKEYCLQAFQNQAYPFDELVKELKFKRDTSRNPLFDIMFVYQNNGYPSINFTDAQAEYFIPNGNVAKFDLTLEVIPVNDELSLRFEYCTKLFDEQFISRLSSHYINILNAILDNQDIKIANIDMLSKAERNQILNVFNDTTMDYPKDKTIVDLFEEQVLKTPDNVAVVFEDKKLTYRELNEKANQLANYLQSNGVLAKDIIGIMLPRSFDTIISILATIKLGCAYILVDYTLPQERIAYMLQNANAKLLITTSELSIPSFETQIIVVDNSIEKCDNSNISKHIDIYDPFTILYTSGSTGKPKGVILTHIGVTNMFLNYIHTLNVTKCSNFLSISTVSFDMFLVEFIVPILSGKTLILSNDEEQKIPTSTIKLIAKYNVDFILTTPSRMDLLLSQDTENSSLKNVKIIQLGGEALTNGLLEKLRPYTDANIFNGYGPSEITACCSSKNVTLGKINIGRPFYNFKIYIVDRDFNICPIGVPGELCIAGDGLSLGYINNEDLTRKSFIKNPFGDGLLYRSGDIGKYTPNFEIDYIGRNDNQVKIRGLRVELSEIEKQLLKIKGIDSCCVIYRKELQYISAFITSKCSVNISEIKKELSQVLPLYMVPKYITQIEKLPVTSNGKINRNLLYNYSDNKLSDEAIVPPSTELEKLCCDIWEQLLNTKIGITDDIFNYGADSLLAIKFKTQMLAHNINIPYANIFKYPKISDLCNNISFTEKDSLNNYDYSKINELLQNNSLKNLSTYSIIKNKNNNILLLGSNGFVGMHILHSLITLDSGKIYCIVRDKNNMLAKDRFLNALHFYFNDELDKYINDRIFIINGNILKDNFGLSEKLINEINNNTDIVINSAALVKHYGSENSFYNANIVSTNNIVNFCKSHNKRLIHISSLSVSGNDTLEGNKSNDLNDENMSFSESNLYIGQKINNLYVNSKFESEKIILNDIVDGNLNAQILRLGNITNRFSDGKFQINPTENAFVNKLKSMIQLGKIPDYLSTLYLEFTPVDICSKSIVLIVQNYVKEFSVFHLYDNNHVYMNDLIKILSDLNINLNIVNEDEFKKAINKLLNKNSTTLDGIINDFNADKKISYSSNISILSEFSRAFLYSLGFVWPNIDNNYFSKYIKNLRDINLI